MAKNKAQLIVKPWCPFCGQDVMAPEEPRQRKMDEFSMGSCQCGALFVSDQTGHNIGAAMVECLVTACNDNWELAWDLDPDEDYLTDIVENYDEVTHQVVETRNLDGRAVRGILYFVRLNHDIAKLASNVSNDPTEEEFDDSYIPAMEPLRDPKRLKKRTSKIQVKKFADQGDIDSLVDVCFDDGRTLRFLQRLLYAPEEDQRWYYAHVLGRVCARYASRKPGAVSDLLHRLFEACSDSAASHWGLVESVGSIISARPDIFGGFTNHILMFRNLDSTRARVVWALAEIAYRRPDIVKAAPLYSLFDFLIHPDPLTRGYAALLFGLIKATEVRSRVEELIEDKAPVVVYHEGLARETTVAALAQRAILQMTEEKKDK